MLRRVSRKSPCDFAGTARVPVKSAGQQAEAMLLFVRELLSRQRTPWVNAARGHAEPRGSPDAAELGLVAAQGGKGLRALLAMAREALPDLAMPALAPLERQTGHVEAELAQAGQARGGGPGQHGRPRRVGDDDERTGASAASHRLTARQPQGQGLPEKMLTGRTDDPQNPRRAAAKQAGHTTAAASDQLVPRHTPLHPKGPPHPPCDPEQACPNLHEAA